MVVQDLANRSGTVVATTDGVEVIRTSPAVLPHSMITVVNDGPGNVTDIVISKLTTNVEDCPWVDIFGGTDYTPNASGIMLNNILEATAGMPALAPGDSGVISFNHFNPYLWRVVVTSDAPASVTIYCRR